jgi:hypothetical protein
MTASRVKFDDGHSETDYIGTLGRKSGQFANALVVTASRRATGPQSC